VLYNAKYDHYVLWFNHPYTKGSAIGKSPVGPFTLMSWDVGLPMGSDGYFWTDQTNGNTYIKYNGKDVSSSLTAHYVSLLTDDWLGVVPGATSNPMVPPAYPIPPFYEGEWPECSEGGGMFSYGGKWYVMMGTCCCFCAEGASAWVWMADTPLGMYTLKKNVISWNNDTQKYATGAQQFSVAPIFTPSGVVPMYIGQRFGSAKDGLKCHDFQYWYPLQFDDNGMVEEITFVDSFTLQLV
jgi:hypothetical protein